MNYSYLDSNTLELWASHTSTRTVRCAGCLVSLKERLNSEIGKMEKNAKREKITGTYRVCEIICAASHFGGGRGGF